MVQRHHDHAYPGQLNTSDTVSSGNYVVTLNVSPAYPISSLSAMTASGGITVSGTYTLVVTSMITCGTNTNGIIYVAAGGNLTLGNSATPLSITASGTPAIVVAMGPPGGTATIYANITGGCSNNAYGVSNAGTCTIYGNVTGGMMTAAYGVYCSSGTTTIYGNVTASGSAHGLYAMGGNVNVNNTASALAVISAPSMSYNGIYNSGTAMIYLTGCVLVYPNSSGTSNAPVYGSFTWTKNAFSGFRMATDSSTTYYASTYYSDPGVNNVLSGTTYSYGGTNNKTGAYVLPNNAGVSSLVTYGVSGGTTGGLASSKIMDATYGTLAVSFGLEHRRRDVSSRRGGERAPWDARRPDHRDGLHPVGRRRAERDQRGRDDGHAGRPVGDGRPDGQCRGQHYREPLAAAGRQRGQYAKLRRRQQRHHGRNAGDARPGRR